MGRWPATSRGGPPVVRLQDPKGFTQAVREFLATL